MNFKVREGIYKSNRARETRNRKPNTVTVETGRRIRMRSQLYLPRARKMIFMGNKKARNRAVHAKGRSS